MLFSTEDCRPGIVRAMASARLKRQENLQQRKCVEIAISEYALVSRILPRDAHLEQLDKLISVSETNLVDLEVMPLNADITFAVPCSFNIFDKTHAACDAVERDALVWDTKKDKGVAAHVQGNKGDFSVREAPFREKVEKAKRRI